MRIISIKRIRQFIEKHSDSESSLLAWHDTVKAADWEHTADLKKMFPSADMVGKRMVFNIAHNRYRLIARVNYRSKRVFVLFILTHKEYDQGGWKE